jgi:flagellar M-ring protein FliF
MAEAEGVAVGGGKNDLIQGMSGLNVFRQVGLMLGLAASVAIGFAVVMWSQGEDYIPLYADLDRINPQDVINILQTNEIQFKVDEKTGALMVVADKIHQARLKMAGAGINADGSFGFELLDKEQPLGTSRFMESARFKRSLEGELARTITSIRTVRSARVHLAIPKASAFIRDPRKPTASVFVDLYSGSGITSEQVRAIANLVATSIPELALQNVTVVDQNGNLLSNFEESRNMAVAHKQLDYTHKMEERYVHRIQAILTPMLGDRFHAEVSADVDFTQIEQTDELFNPDLPAIRSEQTVEEARAGGAGVGGVPGALSNQPPADGQAPAVAGGVEAGAGGTGSSRRQSTRNYELDRTISHTRHQFGRLRRLSVAVVVDNLTQVDAETGEETSMPMAQEQLQRLESLLRDAVGFDAARGDTVSVMNSSFLPKAEVIAEPVPETPVWEQPWVMNIAKQVMAAVFVLLLVFGILRPVMRSLSDSAREVREVEAQRALGELSGDLGGDLGEETVTLSGGDTLMLPGKDGQHEQNMNAIKGLVAEDPGRVAQVVKKWVAAGE